MSADKYGNGTPELGKIKSGNRLPLKEYIALGIIIAILVSTFVVYFQMNSEPSVKQTITFILKGHDDSWFTGNGFIWFANGSLQILTPWPAWPLLDEHDVPIGFQSWLPVDGTFVGPETCRFEYDCPALNLTIGPMSFISNQHQILYQDQYDRTIELAIGYIG